MKSFNKVQSNSIIIQLSIFRTDITSPHLVMNAYLQSRMPLVLQKATAFKVFAQLDPSLGSTGAHPNDNEVPDGLVEQFAHTPHE